MDPTLTLTLCDSLYDIDRVRSVTLTWPQLVEHLGTHLRLHDKEKAPGFLPGALVAPPAPCHKHHGPPRDQIHRCDVCVREITVATFDVDIGSQAAVEACDSRLEAAGLSRYWYSSFSFHKNCQVPSLRLLVPLATPVPASGWRSFRKAVISRYGIPADIRKCSGLSHFYFVPSAPPGVPTITDFSDGAFLDPADVPHFHEVTSAQALAALGDYALPEEPRGPVDLEPLRKELEKRVTRMLRATDDPDQQRKGELLKRCLRGLPLAEHGDRNNATRDVAGIIAWTLSPPQPVSVLMRFILPSLDAMIANGSKLSYPKVESLFVRSLKNRALAEATDREIEERWSKAAAEARSKAPVVNLKDY